MKIILLIIMLLPLMNVDAATYYSDYEYYIKNTDEYLEETDLIKREEYKVYNTYETRIKELGYANKDNCKYYYENKKIENETYSKTKFTSEDKLYQALEFYDLTITDFSITKIKTNYLTLYELISKNNDKKENVTVLSTDVSHYNGAVDGNPATGVVFARNTAFSFRYKNTLVNDLTIEFFTMPMIKGEVKITLTDPKTGITTVHPIVINAEVIEFKSSDEIKKIKAVIGDFDNVETFGTYYKSVETQHLCYDYEDVVLNNYVQSGNNIIKDDYKTHYNYQKRDYLTIKDKITTKTTLDELIVATSYNPEDIKIEHNIDYSKSGQYEIIFKIGNNEYNHQVDYEYVEPTTTTTTTKPTTTTTTKQVITTTIKPVKTTTTTKVNLVKKTTSKSTINQLKETTTTTTTTTKEKTTTTHATIESTEQEYEDNSTIKIIIISLIILSIILLTLYLTYKKS